MTAGDPETRDDGLDIVSRLSLAISHVTMFCIPVIVVAVIYEIIMRYAFSKATAWVTDLSIWLGAITYLIAGLYAMQQRAHIAIPLVYDMVPPKVRLAFDVIALVVLLTFAIAFIVGAGPNAWGALRAWERVGTSWNPPVPGTVKPLIIVVIFMIAVQAVVNFVADYRGGRRQKPEALPEVD